MKIEQLPDEELARQAKGLAHRCEVELRRRFGMPEPAILELQPPSLDVPLPAPRAPRWRWRLI